MAEGTLGGILLVSLILNAALWAWLRSARRTGQELEQRVAQGSAALSASAAALSASNESLAEETATRRALQLELQQALDSEKTAHAAQKEFVAMVSHEFRNPLAVIDTAAQRMQNSPAATDDLTASAGRIRRSVSRLVSLVENCLTEDRLSSSELAPRVAGTDLGELLKANYMPDSSIGGRIRLHVPASPVRVQVDSNLLGIAISNLVENALKYSPADSQVAVILATTGTQAEVRVVDRGNGIGMADRARIFEKFYRAQEAQGHSGAGLGLYLARELARRHGGEVSLLHSSPGTGTCFVLSVPMGA